MTFMHDRLICPCTSRVRRFAGAFLLLACFVAAAPATAQGGFDANPTWPLCGDWYDENSSWTVATFMATTMPPSCPASRWNADHTDEIKAPYGPRHLNNKLEYDWHRGIDVPTRTDFSSPAPADIHLQSRRPVFAIAAGKVIKCEIMYPSTSVAKPCSDYLADVANGVCPGPTSCPDPELLDLRLVIEHERPSNAGIDRCAPDGCYYSRYTHLSMVRELPHDLMTVDPYSNYATVAKGEFIGMTGQSWRSTYDHLHFEIRSSSLDETDDSQRETINPLAVLPYHDSAVGSCADDPTATCDDSLSVSFEVPTDVEVRARNAAGNWFDLIVPFPIGSDPLDLSSPMLPKITVKAQVTAGSDEQDLDRIEVRVSSLDVSGQGGYELTPILQGATGSTVTTTPEGQTWLETPPFLDFQDFNLQYTYKNEVAPKLVDHGHNQTPVLFSDFTATGAYSIPAPLQPGFPSSWGSGQADVHLTQTDCVAQCADPYPVEVAGEFNGLRIWPARFQSKDDPQIVYARFEALEGSMNPLCIEALAYDIQGNRSASVASHGPCAPPAPVDAWFEWNNDPVIHWDPVPEATFYRVWYYSAFSGVPVQRQSVVYEGAHQPISLGRPVPWAGYAVEACYASAPRCGKGASGESCSTAQCSPLVEVAW